LHKTLTVKCSGLKEWAQAHDPAKLLLYLDGTAMTGLVPKIDRTNAKGNCLYFRLERISGSENKNANSKAWDALLSRPKGFGKNGDVRVTVGPETGIPFESDQTARLEALDVNWFIAYAIGFGVLLVGMIWLGRSSNLLRDSGGSIASDKHWPYSLARCQMAFWFFLIVAAYAFIFMVTGAVDTLTGSVLALMGISASTGLAAVAVDNSKRSQAQAELDKLNIEKATLEAQKAAATTASPFPADREARLRQLNGEPGIDGLIAQQTTLLVRKPSEWFVKDILSDADGISFHRLQIAVWTIVLGIIFGISVYNVLSMPTFSAELLALLGISGGTYIGFKFPEKLS
jgi:hypothetical protein